MALSRMAQMTTAVVIDRLRRQLRAAETATGLPECPTLTLGIPPIDGILGGGLGRGALHEIAAVRESETAAATGFALALAARNARSAMAGRSLFWIAEDLSLAENGAPYGPGLDEAGIAPEHVITVAAARSRDVLRARDIDQVASRRLSLAAAAGNTLGLILRTAPDDAPSAAATRWIVGAAPFPAEGDERFHGIGPPRFIAHLIRNRRGHLGAWIVEWNSVEQRFELATHSQPVAGAAVDRPHRAAVA